MRDRISIREAAIALSLSPARIRAMVVRGQLPAEKIADRWVVDRSAVERRKRQETPRGRRFTPQNAWALLMLASGEDAPHIDPSVRSRLKKALALEGLMALAPRLRTRASVSSYKAHPGEIPYVLEDKTLVRSGISAAGSLKLDLLPGREADGYIAQSQVQGFIAQHALSSVESDGNVQLRIVPDDAWSNIDGRFAAPPAAIALDLAEELDPRSQAAGEELLREIDRDQRARAKSRR
jgi:hypothetical protein